MKIATKLDEGTMRFLSTASKPELKEFKIALVEQCTTCGSFHTIQRVKTTTFVQACGPMKKWVNKLVYIPGIGISYVVPGRSVCDDCHVANMYRLVRVFNKPDESIQSMMFYHGLLTGMCDHNHTSPVTAMKKFSDIAENMSSHDLTNRWELCASTMPIGPVGIRVIGQVNLAGNGDLWSDYDQSGERFASPHHFDKIVVSRKDLEVLYPGEDHNEVFIQVDKIHSAWVDTAYSYREELVEFFTAQGIPVK